MENFSRTRVRNLEKSDVWFVCNLQSVDQLNKKVEGLRSSYLTQTQNLCDVVGAHETISSSSLHKLNSTVSAHASALDQVSFLWFSQVFLYAFVVFYDSLAFGFGGVVDRDRH